MKTAVIFDSIRRTTTSYRERIQTLQAANFEKTPADGTWSYSEVFAHIFDLSILSLDAIDRCLSMEAKKRRTPFIARAILFIGAFPPVMKLKVPKQFASRVKKISIAEAVSLMAEFELKLQSYPKLVAQADPNLKVAHPRLGYLNARQWLRFIEIHLKHHLKQLKRIDKLHNFTSLRNEDSGN